METKLCGNCHRILSIDAFPFQNKKLGTHISWCRDCRNIYHKAYYQKHRDVLLQTAKEWAKKNPERVKERGANYWSKEENRLKRRDHDLRKNYGISLDDYEKILQKQDGVCAICKGTNVDKRVLSLDHNHKTGKIRGLLCSKCNYAVGLLHDSSILAKSMMIYLRRFNDT